MIEQSAHAAQFMPRIVSSSRSLAAFLRAQEIIPALPSAIEPDAEAAGTSRLVKGAEFPTRFVPDPETGEAIELPPQWTQGTGSNAPSAYTVLSYREWDDTWKLRPQVEARRVNVPAPEAGPRVTENMTRNARRAIDESARYLAATGRGFRTMLTLTLDSAARQRVAVQRVEGDYSDLASRETVQHVGRCSPLIEADGLLVAAGVEAEGTHSLAPLTTMQGEASRFFDAAQKIYGRGMDYIAGRDYRLADGSTWTVNSVDTAGKPLRCRLPGHAVAVVKVCDVRVWADEKERLHFERPGNAAIPRDVRKAAAAGAPFSLVRLKLEPMRYVWAAENPKNEHGQDNPHIHVILDWEVPLAAFRDWSRRLEEIWGQGFAHLERLRDAAAAGGYLLKAAGYLSKAESSNQGWIVGNRYFISSTARAPKFQSVAVLPYGQLPLLMEHAAHHQRETLEPLRRARRAAREAMDTANKKGRAVLTGKLKALGKAIDGRAVIAGKWQMLLRGTAALWKFLFWAGDAGDRQAEGRELPSKPAGFAWSHEMDNGAESWHAPARADVVERREGRHWWRQLLRQPVLTEDDLQNQCEWYAQYEPVTAWGW